MLGRLLLFGLVSLLFLGLGHVSLCVWSSISAESVMGLAISPSLFKDGSLVSISSPGKRFPFTDLKVLLVGTQYPHNPRSSYTPICGIALVFLT